MEMNKILQLIGLIVVVIIAFALMRLALGLAIGVAQIALIVAAIAALYFFAERLFGKGR
jgi:putative flippase GtrA